MSFCCQRPSCHPAITTRWKLDFLLGWQELMSPARRSGVTSVADTGRIEPADDADGPIPSPYQRSRPATSPGGFGPDSRGCWNQPGGDGPSPPRLIRRLSPLSSSQMAGSLQPECCRPRRQRCSCLRHQLPSKRRTLINSGCRHPVGAWPCGADLRQSRSEAVQLRIPDGDAGVGRKITTRSVALPCLERPTSGPNPPGC